MLNDIVKIAQGKFILNGSILIYDFDYDDNGVIYSMDYDESIKKEDAFLICEEFIKKSLEHAQRK